MKNTLIAILVIIILVLGFLFVKGKSKPVVDNSWPETVPANPTDNNSQTNSNNNTNPCAPSIVVSAPATGASYTLGQQVTIKWTTCNVQKVLIGLASGGKNYGHITQNPISASMGSYQWVATNPGKDFTSQNTNSYQIVVESEDGSVMAKSGTFSVTTQQNNNSGVPVVDLDLKLYTRASYSFQAPKNWNETGPTDFEGCAWDGVSNDTNDGLRMAGEVGIYPKSCFNLSNANGYKEMTEIGGFYILAYYDRENGTTPAEEAETKAVYQSIVSSFQVR